MSPRHVSLPSDYVSRLRPILTEIGFELNDSRAMAAAVLQLSDYYLANPDAATPWSEPWAQAASLAYYFPLNYCRSIAVAHEARRLGFLDGLTSFHDFGAGMGAALHAWADVFPSLSLEASDVSSTALKFSDGLSPAGRSVARTRKANPASSVLVASYVFTELEAWPLLWNEYEAVAVIEPSTQRDARRLMGEREPLMSVGYSLWAPCTHSAACPLYVHSAKDWCHDRVHFDAPDWFLEIEKHLPMKNRTLTFSYLLARRGGTRPSVSGLARMVGDTLPEKGKSRQALCRSDEREFLSWFPQRGVDLEIERGALVALDGDVEKKSNEVRVREASQVRVLGSEETPS